MSISRVQTQVTWDTGSVTKTVSSATEVVSDVITLADNTVGLSIQIHADNQGTPASGDTAVFRLRWSNGDVLGAGGADTYDTAEHAEFLTVLDTYGSNTPGEDPARRTIMVPPVAKKMQTGCICSGAASRNLIIAARIDEQRMA
jgi:hypothetical protein